MRGETTVFALLGLCTIVALPASAFSAEKTADNPNGCKVVERKGGAPSGSLSSSVTAGGGRVSGYTSAGGNSVTVYSNNGGSVATAGTAGGGQGSTMVASGNGDCTIYVDPGKSKD
ncbi:MAG TPA: glycosyl hydrolase [Stellaceae bacterium]|nr:glycosyl hydrolase [Stellaceae bacterium]